MMGSIAARHRVFALVLVTTAALVLSACTITIGDPSPTPATSVRPSAQPTADVDVAEPGAAAIAAPGRLAIVGADGSLVTMRPNGGAIAELTPGGDDTIALQPAWSPDGDRLAWVSLDAGNGSASIVVASARGEDPVEAETPFPAYYLSWSPTGDRVAFLGAGGDPETPVEMGVLDLRRDTPRVRSVAGGEPFLYFAWAPDGKRVLAHAGFDRLEEIDLAGRSTAVSRQPGLFATPAWSADGDTLVYTVRIAGDRQRLVAVTDGGAPQVLLESRGAISFVLRPDGRAVAYQVLEEGEGDFFDRRPAEPGDGVRVVDVRTGVTRRATTMRAMTFWWSPDGRQLLALAPEPETSGPIPFLWQIWDGGRPDEAAGRHSPTLMTLRDYAPFFTQYAQSTTPWAPDGSAFAFPMESSDGAGRIAVQEVGGSPVVVARGVYVTWSP